MSRVIDRWIKNHEHQGAYSALAGFEADIKGAHEAIALAYDDMDIYAQVAFFGFVTDLLAEEVCGSTVRQQQREDDDE
jgi:hypothetical protein